MPYHTYHTYLPYLWDYSGPIMPYHTYRMGKQPAKKNRQGASYMLSDPIMPYHTYHTYLPYLWEYSGPIKNDRAQVVNGTDPK